ncbi:MAG: hypothetical protein ACOYJ1_01585 [Peptococcales bacterium]|jgi:hypothetical protein
MLQSFTKKYTDESTKEKFRFTFYCDICGKQWQSVPISFSQGKGKTFWERLFGVKSSLWKSEHKDAFERANREGMFYFNRCTDCKKWVCDDDFSEEEGKCRECIR